MHQLGLCGWSLVAQEMTMNGYLSLCCHLSLRSDDECISLGLRVVTGCVALTLNRHLVCVVTG